MTHLAIDYRTQRVVASFTDSATCAYYCNRPFLVHVPFNSAKHAAPAVGSVYVAA